MGDLDRVIKSFGVKIDEVLSICEREGIEIKVAQHSTPNGAAKGLKLAAEIYHYGKGGVATDGFKAIELIARRSGNSFSCR